MKQFLDEHFLLNSKFAEQLYHDYARDMPIVDYQSSDSILALERENKRSPGNAS